MRPQGLYSPWNSPGQNTGVGSLFLLQGIFPTQESNPGLLHCRQILYQLSYQGSLFGYGSVQHSPLPTMTCAWGYKSVWQHYTYKTIWKPPTKKITSTSDFTGELFQILSEEVLPILNKLFQKIEEWITLRSWLFWYQTGEKHCKKWKLHSIISCKHICVHA